MTKQELLRLKVGNRVRHVGYPDGGHEVIEVGYNAIKVKWPEGVGIADGSHAEDLEVVK